MKDIKEVAPGLINSFQPIEGVTTSGQPEAEHFGELASAGYRMVVDLRDPGETRDFDEVVAVIMAGMEYVNIPVTPETVGYEDFSQFRELLDDPARRPVLVHCSSGDRAGGLLLPYLILDEGMAPEEAEEVASQAGLENEVLEQAALRYVSLVSTD